MYTDETEGANLLWFDLACDCAACIEGEADDIVILVGGFSGCLPRSPQ